MSQRLELLRTIVNGMVLSGEIRVVVLYLLRGKEKLICYQYHTGNERRSKVIESLNYFREMRRQNHSGFSICSLLSLYLLEKRRDQNLYYCDYKW